MGEDGWLEDHLILHTYFGGSKMSKLINLNLNKLIGFHNITMESSEDVQSFFFTRNYLLEVLELRYEDCKIMKMHYLNFKWDLSKECPNEINMYYNTYINRRLQINRFAVIRSLGHDSIHLTLVARKDDMNKIKRFLVKEPQRKLSEKRKAYKQFSKYLPEIQKELIGKFFLQEFSKQERSLCWKLHQRNEVEYEIADMLSCYYKDNYSIEDVIEAYDINYYNINEIIELIEYYKSINEFKMDLVEYKECLEEEDNSF